MDYEKLYKAYYLQVYSYTISLAKNREIAEEITQDTFYKAVSTTSQFKGKSNELTWLCSIAKNLYYDEMRSRQRIADVSEINDLPSNENVENSVTDSDMEIRYSDEKPGIQNLINIYSCITGKTIEEVEKEFDGKGYGDFKMAVGETVADRLRPLQDRFYELQKDKTYLNGVIKENDEKAAYFANKTLRKVQKKVGLTERIR